MEQSMGITEEGLSILMPPREIFLHSHTETPTDMLLEQKTVVYELERAEYPDTGGIFIYYKGVKYPKKCFPFPDALNAVQIVKRNTRIFLSLGVLPIALNFHKFIAEYCRCADWLLRPFYLKAHRYATSTRELRTFVTNFMAALSGMKISETAEGGFNYVYEGLNSGIGIHNKYYAATNLGLIIATIVEYDNAYRYMMQDVMSTVNDSELYLYPRQTLKKMLATFKERADPEVARKVGVGVKLLLTALLIPRVKKAFKRAIELANITNFKMDAIDGHHVLIQQDYKYGGRSLKQRMKMYEECYPEGLPTQLTIMQKQKI